MNDQNDIPLLTDLIEKGVEFTMSDLGLEDPPVTAQITTAAGDLEIELDEPTLPLRDYPLGRNPAAIEPESLADNPALEREVRRILDEHMELAWLEIRLAIQRHLERS